MVSIVRVMMYPLSVALLPPGPVPVALAFATRKHSFYVRIAVSPKVGSLALLAKLCVLCFVYILYTYSAVWPLVLLLCSCSLRVHVALFRYPGRLSEAVKSTAEQKLWLLCVVGSVVKSFS